MIKINKEEKTIYEVFEITIILKGIHAAIEIIGGVLILFINQAYVISQVLSIAQLELSEDPKDVVANYFLKISSNFSVSSQHFMALYLLSHGVIKLFLVIGLLRKKLWAYPASMVVFSLFIVYQLYRYYFTHSVFLLLITLLDIVVIVLTWHEYERMKK